MKIKVTRIHDWNVVTLQGQFIVKSIPAIRQQLEMLETSPFSGVVFDMQGVTQLDSSAITLLVNFQRRVLQKERSVILVNLPGDIAEVLSIVGIDKIFRICANFDEFRKLYIHEVR